MANGYCHMRVCVVGSGYVGLVAAACLCELGHDITCVDNDREKIEALAAGRLPIHERFLPELFARHHGSRLRFSQDLVTAVKESAAIFIAVGTPSTDEGSADLYYVESVTREIARGLNAYKVIVEKSTVPVFTNDWIRRTLLRDGAPADTFEVASNPEFLREGSAVTDFLYPDRIVVGADSQRGAELLARIYEPLTSGAYARQPDAIPSPAEARVPAPLIVTSTKSAELIKHASNAFLAMKISFINAVANVCEAVGADIRQVCEGVGSDSRIGPGFLRPGIGYGGSCFPKDLKAFSAIARESGYEFRLLDEVIRINEEQRQRFLRKVRSSLWTLKNKRLAVLGLSFKGGTDDIRESPAVPLIEMLLKDGCAITAYDPAAMPRAREVFGERIGFAPDPYAAAHGADALLVLTDWEEFTDLDFDRLRTAMKYPIIVDGRNLYDPAEMEAKGFTYCSVGRSDAVPGRRASAGSSNV